MGLRGPATHCERCKDAGSMGSTYRRQDENRSILSGEGRQICEGHAERSRGQLTVGLWLMVPRSQFSSRTSVRSLVAMSLQVGPNGSINDPSIAHGMKWALEQFYSHLFLPFDRSMLSGLALSVAARYLLSCLFLVPRGQK